MSKSVLQITSLDAAGNIVDTECTKEDWCLSEIDYYFELMKGQLYRGEIEHIIIDKIS